MNDTECVPFATGIICNRKDWQSSGYHLKGKSNKTANLVLRQIENSINHIYFELTSQGKFITADVIKEIYNSPQETMTLLSACREHQADQMKVIPKTAKRYTRYIDKLSEFLESKGLSKMVIHEVSPKLSHNYKFFLAEKGYSVNYASRCRRFISQVLDWCVDKEMIDHNRLIRIKYPSVKSKKVFLTEPEIKLLQNKRFKIDRIEKIRKLFLLQCYLGVSYGDLAAINKDSFEFHNDQIWLKKYRGKSDIFFLVPIFEEAKRLLIECSFQPNVMSNGNYNAYLKEIADLTRIKKNLTTHVARRTFAMYLLNEGLSFEAVSKLLGHTSVQTTQRYYAEFLGESIQREIEEKDLRRIFKAAA
ncbi:MAG: site-specific integrase [Bacteroidota bacterium]